MGKALSAIATYMWPGGTGASQHDDLTHSFDSFHDISRKDADGNMINFSKYKGQVVMVVNSARKWGKRRQIPPTIALYNKYKDQGFEVLYFPSKQFGTSKDKNGNKVEGQEPGTIQETQQAYREEFQVEWPIFDYVTCNGPETSDVYKFLRSAQLKNQHSEKNSIEWNFGKFIVNRKGQVIKRYGPGVSPDTFDCDEKIVEWLRTTE